MMRAPSWHCNIFFEASLERFPKLSKKKKKKRNLDFQPGNVNDGTNGLKGNLFLSMLIRGGDEASLIRDKAIFMQNEAELVRGLLCQDF